MMMQKLSRLTAYHTTAIYNTTRTPRTAHQSRDAKKWSAALLYAVVVAAGVATPTADPVMPSSEAVALQGHAKRYMRINEYLFHGTQKTTAIARYTEDNHRHRV